MLAVSAAVVSLLSLFLAIENAVAMRRLVASNIWPFVNVGVSTADESGRPALGLVIQNKGIGPAKIESLEVFYRGKPMAGEAALIEAMTGGRQPPFVRTRVAGSVVSAGESTRFMSVVDRLADAREMETLATLSDRIALRTCYCSVFDECFLLDRTRSPSTRKEVDDCPAPKVSFQ